MIPSALHGITYSSVDGKSVTFSGTANGSEDRTGWFGISETMFSTRVGHNVLILPKIISGSFENGTIKYSLFSGVTCDFSTPAIRKVGETQYTQRLLTRVTNGTVANDFTVTFICIDLTQMFGSTIADYIYSLEQATAGAGVAWFKKLFPKDYYEYNAGELISVSGLQSHNMVGFNALDPTKTRVGGAYNPTVGNTINLDTSGATYSGTNPIVIDVTAAWRGCCLISDPLIAGQQYEVILKTSAPNTAGKRISQYLIDEDNRVITSPYNFVGNSGDSVVRTFTPPTSGLRCAVTIASTSAQRINVTDACVHFSNPSRNGEYEPYVKHTYPLDNSLTLRGIPKLDASNSLYYDGDTYESDGTVTRKYGVVDLGGLTWNKNKNSQGDDVFSSNGIQTVVKNGLCICSRYKTNTDTARPASMTDKTLSINAAPLLQSGYFGIGEIIIKDSSYTSQTGAEFKTAMSGVLLVYELATPTTETAEPYVSP